MGFESTPLLLDRRSPPAASPLSRSYGQPASTRRRVGGYPAATSSQRRFQGRSQAVHPLHRKSLHPSSMTSSRQFSSSVPSSSRQFSSPTTTRSSSSQTTSNLTPNKIWQAVVSLPYHMLCFASPICPPCCVCCCFTCIRTSEYGVLQRFGKFERFLNPGCHFMKWPMEREAGRISMRIRQLNVDCETKTKDHVILRVHVSIQYQTNSTHLFESFYSLKSPTQLLSSHVHDVIRSTLPQLDLDEVFASKDSIALELHRSLNGTMNQYGYLIEHALITHIRPNEHVKQSMNEMEASKREKLSMHHKAESVKIQAVKDAEARAEQSHLNGLGVARQRQAIASGMKDVASSVVDGAGESGTIPAKSVMDLLLLTQYFDLLTELNGDTVGKGNVVEESPGDERPSSSMFIYHMPDTVGQLTEAARKCFGSDMETVKVENLLEL
eukprot:CAMPEP_0183721260 /NCGR_PEP_ID=MMETSP0737-20130205/13587_1 /TAXON_ID=385413 /ORGANISM="Thalassiosira miniscula, Strain CCMP1093" /LENGTH=438 /DNA_ID=CAMNT_0025951237 /DNA_START=146 /DNA_END=1462 /DNA_ORIENTATION=-